MGRAVCVSLKNRLIQHETIGWSQRLAWGGGHVAHGASFTGTSRHCDLTGVSFPPPDFDPNLGMMAAGITPLNPMMPGLSMVPAPVSQEVPLVKEIIHCKSCTLFPPNPSKSWWLSLYLCQLELSPSVMPLNPVDSGFLQHTVFKQSVYTGFSTTLFKKQEQQDDASFMYFYRKDRIQVFPFCTHWFQHTVVYWQLYIFKLENSYLDLFPQMLCNIPQHVFLENARPSQVSM